MKKTNKLELTQKNDVSIKETEIDNINEVTEINRYYLRISERFRLAKIIVVSFLCLFILSSLFIYGEAFTYENARYILRDIGQILSDDSSVPADKISIQADGDMDFDIYKGNIVVAGESNVKIISPSGKEKLSDNTSFTSPCILSSDKYCIVYSLGAYNLSVYNTVARVYDMSFDFPIYDVALSDNGYIAVMTHSREYKCTVYLYNSDFKLSATYNKNKYPSSVGISHDGTQVFISTFSSEDGDYVSELASYEKNSTEALFTHTSYGSLPLELHVLSDNTLSLLYQDKISFINKDGSVLTEQFFSSNVYTADFNKDFITVVEGDTTKKIHVYTLGGVLQGSYNESDASRAYTYDKQTFVQKKSALIWGAGQNIQTIDLKNNTAKVVFSNGYLYVCYSDGIYTYKT